ncbi:hypothetical protein KO498_14320 [Lentibacter algarum]|uniref:hypothetical protein n=1 Tax=Lentibacter algarum TaxID=576131 RepID=UPI001C093643|nr:hypothetical protein [Lentibacter algarum]MBU2982990.1 hypothetical protein [Lentibacter algarum]
MKRFITAVTLAAVTVTATSAFAVTTPEDRAFEEAFRAKLDHKVDVSTKDTAKTNMSGGAVVTDTNGHVLKNFGNGVYDENSERGGRR